MQILQQGRLNLCSLQHHLRYGLRGSEIELEETISTAFVDQER